MKRLILFFLLSLAASAQTVTLNGTLTDTTSSGVGLNAYMRVELYGCGNNPAMWSGGTLVTSKRYPTDANGNLTGLNLVRNDFITCAGQSNVTYYVMTPFVNGTAVPPMSQAYVVNANTITGSSFNWSTSTPITVLPVVATPTGDNTYQRLDGGNHASGSYVPTTDANLNLGSGSSRWNANLNFLIYPAASSNWTTPFSTPGQAHIITTASLGLILFGNGSSSDVTIENNHANPIWSNTAGSTTSTFTGQVNFPSFALDGGGVITAQTGTGSLVLSANPTFSGTLTLPLNSTFTGSSWLGGFDTDIAINAGGATSNGHNITLTAGGGTGGPATGGNINLVPGSGFAGSSDGKVVISGKTQSTTFATTTNCSAVGTAASPSVASCSTASAGHFSCATNATGATCQVNTSAVAAGSEIFVFESDTTATGTALGVTCNTSTTVNPTTRLLASYIAGASFTINLGTVTTNPACFSYFIIN